MNSRKNITIWLVATVLLICAAILIWANQSGKITIWGAGDGEPYPTIDNGKPLSLEGTLKKDGDIYVITGNSQLPYDLYIINSLEVTDKIDSFVGKSVSCYGSLGGTYNNELLLLWINGKTLFTEAMARQTYEFRINKTALESYQSLTENQQKCIFSITSSDEYFSYLIDPSLSDLTDNQKNQIQNCLSGE